MGEPELPALLVSHHRPGFYMRVITEGRVQAGDRSRVLENAGGNLEAMVLTVVVDLVAELGTAPATVTGGVITARPGPVPGSGCPSRRRPR